MKFPFLASFIVFLVWLAYEINKSNNKSAKLNQSFWDRERQANRTRRKPLDDLEYITIPFETLPMDLFTDNPVFAEYHETLRFLNNYPIVNFTGITNTDLKLQYGAPNITELTRYDQNYTSLVRTLQNWGQKLYENGRITEAKNVLEFALSTRTDISATYTLLVTIYQELNTPEKIADMLPVAESLNSASRNTIVRMLQKSCP